MEENLSVAEAIERFMSSENAWMCRTVVAAHASEGFKEFGGVLPALWLSSEDRFPGLWKELMSRLTAPERGDAVEILSQRLAMKSLESIAVCMQYRDLWPERSAARKLRREVKLAKKISKVLLAASCPGLEACAAPPDIAAFCARAKMGVAAALLDYRRLNPASGIWISKLEWSELGEAAVARAESKSMAKSCGEQAEAKRAVPRL